jgi:hypothetical protein
MTQPPSKTKDGMSPGRLAAMVVVIVLVLGALGYSVFVWIVIGGIAGDAVPPVPHGVGDYTGSNSAGIDCEATRQGETPPSADADLRSCDLSGMDLANVTLRDAGLFIANLAHTSLVGADLSGASLSYSNAWGADFTDADLSDANLTGANLTGANLGGVVWSNTTCPDGTNSDTHANTCVGYGA